MATAINKKPSSSPPPHRKSSDPPSERPPDHWILRGFDAVYRFLASLKLAVICILTLALVLAGATFFESAYGTGASRHYFYQNPAFAILLAFLATNIFCAATIRFPWKKRQTGFVITHVGLLIVLAGAFVSLRYSDEGQLGMAEGSTSGELVRIDHGVIRVQKIDPETGKTLKPYLLPFHPGAFSWETDRVAALAKTPAYRTRIVATRAALGVSVLALVGFSLFWAIRRPAHLPSILGAVIVSALIGAVGGSGILVAMTPSSPRRDLLTDKGDPFVFAVTDYLRSSGDREIRAEPAKDGRHLVKMSLLTTPPGSSESTDSLQGRGWFSPESPRWGRAAREAGPAFVSYQLAQGPNADEVVDDFLHPPKDPNKDRVARFHYLDTTGKKRTYEWALGEDLAKPTITLPGSELSVTFAGFKSIPLGNDDMTASLRRATGEDTLETVEFEVRKGTAPKFDVAAVSSLPLLVNSKTGEMPPGLLHIGYFHPPALNLQPGSMSGRKAQVEVMEDPDGKFYWRGFNKDGLMGPPSLIAVGQKVKLATSKSMPMQLALRVDETIAKGRIREVYVPVELPREHRDENMPAIQAEMTVDGETQPISLLRTVGIGAPKWQTLRFPSGTYQVAYDFDRVPFPFTLTLKRFEPGKDPGSGSFATYRSDVDLNDPELGLKDDERVITMNEPLTHRQWSFYQSNFRHVADPKTGQEDALYASFFQVHYDPAWKIVYSGCLFVVLGTFVQFYMRAGLFTDGGKLERQREEAKAAKAHAKANGTPAPSEPKKKTRPVENGAVEDL